MPQLDTSLCNSLMRQQSVDDDPLLDQHLDERVGDERLGTVVVHLVGFLGSDDLVPVLASRGLAVRHTSSRDMPAGGDETLDALLQDGGGHDDSEEDVLAPLELDLPRELGLDTIRLGEVPDLEGDDIGQVVLGEIGANLGDELGRNPAHIQGRRTLGELERYDAILAEFEESGVHVVGVGLLDDSGLGPSEPFETDVGLEANSPDREGAVGMESVDAEDVAHAVVLDDLEQSLHVNNVLVLKTGLIPNVGKGIVPATQLISTDEATRSAGEAELDVQVSSDLHIGSAKDLSEASDGHGVENLDSCGGHCCRGVFGQEEEQASGVESERRAGSFALL